MRDVITIGSLAAAESRRGELIDYVWKGSGLPTADLVADLDVEQADLAGLVRSRIDRLTVPLPHGLASTSYLLWPKDRPNGRFAIYHGGHGEPHAFPRTPARPFSKI